MSTLPPYSTYRTDNKQMMFPQAISHGNILTFTPPGFSQELNVKFPDSRLAVCERCKKNYKTRDMCRVRNNHTEPPWTTAYVCITLDESCTDDDGKYIDKPMTVRMVQWQPFCVKKPFDGQHPVCSSCKKTNRTRSFCRERHKHRQLPWCTVYVMLSALESTDPSTVVADPSKPLAAKEEGDSSDRSTKEDKEEESAEKEKDQELDAPEGETEAAQKERDGEDEVGMIDSGFEETDDVNDIPESRTFLAKVSYKGMSIHWLDLPEDQTDAGPSMGFIAPEAIRQASAGMDPSQAQYYQQAMGYPSPSQPQQQQQQQQQGTKAQQQQQQQQQHIFFPTLRGQQPLYPGQQWQPPAYSQQQSPGASQAPVTAGEAAAQQQKQSQSASEGEQNSGIPWQMMYSPPMYHMQQGQYGGTQSQGQTEQQETQNGELGGELDDDDGDEGPDPKRVRMV